MDKITLLEELRLIERGESEVNGAWKGAHLLLFFLAFVFGSFCTFCFHMLMYLFDEKCVLFPKLLSLTSLRHNVIYEFIPEDKERADMLPVDFLSTQWVEKSACYLPTYVPLVSGIFGLVWTTMFLMCSTGSRSSLQRPWRVIPPVLVFSLAMGGLCIYSSAVTHNGLRDLCVKLGEITGSSTCSYTVNVATLAYERQIRGVYQATRLTITSAWLHTCCWLASAVLAMVRILLAVDFRLVKVRVELVGDTDKMLERNEQQLRTVSPHHWNDDDRNTSLTSVGSTQIFFQNENYEAIPKIDIPLKTADSDILYITEQINKVSEMSLVPEERRKLAKIEAYHSVKKEHEFIINILYDLLDSILYSMPDYIKSPTMIDDDVRSHNIKRYFGQQTITSRHDLDNSSYIDETGAEAVYKEIKEQLQKKITQQLIELKLPDNDELEPSTSKRKGRISFESSLNITPEMKEALKERLSPSDESRNSSTVSSRDEKGLDAPKKSNLKKSAKNVGVQTEKKHKKRKKDYKVTINESKSTYIDDEYDSSLDSYSNDEPEKEKEIKKEPQEKTEKEKKEEQVRNKDKPKEKED